MEWNGIGKACWSDVLPSVTYRYTGTSRNFELPLEYDSTSLTFRDNTVVRIIKNRKPNKNQGN